MVKKIKWISLIVGIGSVLAGAYLFVRPMVSLASLSIVFAAVMLTHGIFEVVRYFSDKENKRGAVLCHGIISILLALLLFSSPFLEMATFIPYILAFWVLVSGSTRAFLGFSLRKEKEEQKEGNRLLLTGIAGIVVGLLMCMNPFFTGLIIAYMIGFGFLYQGFESLVIFFKANRENA